jgi:superfamily I DNA and/or RNA helicase
VEYEESKSNRGEALVVCKHIVSLVRAGVKAREMAVITPYNAQVVLLREMLSKTHGEVEVGTVDGFQVCCHA